ncbi:hypothetical protein N7462_001653 [Penicillium macrosclerotiorum]|uniref:uncharacterized protein n=1 Tax=Penicillium macrosclerotiorum TaxID=303699 RepID=UPI00254951AB|nr:uncharacterized protein N7462_001653 [Penicillium macrosclerotiorum]KAJ5692230.1 hypothetical protein N7462_001653 [Penicillium macrosclerotiorum]
MQCLANDTVYQILINLTKDEATSFRNTIEKTLEDFSMGSEGQYQPEPSAISRPNGQRTLFRGFTSDASVGAKIIVEPAPVHNGKKEALHGILILMDGNGNPTSVLGAEEVTGYRTSMNVMVPFSWRKHVDSIIIFGCGVQALWHARLILTLRGSEVKTITFANRSRYKFDELIETLSRENKTRWMSGCSFHHIDTTATDFQQQIKTCLNEVDCIFCTTPSQKALFPADYLTRRSRNGQRQPFISAAGSWQSDMMELDPALLHHAIATEGGYNPVNGNAHGVVLVDDRNYSLYNSGEVVQSKIAARDMVELGEIVSLRSGKTKPLNNQHIELTNRFISQGFVVYKSIGVSLTDLTAANAIVALRKKKQSQF